MRARRGEEGSYTWVHVCRRRPIAAADRGQSRAGHHLDRRPFEVAATPVCRGHRVLPAAFSTMTILSLSHPSQYLPDLHDRITTPLP